jgi:glycine/D-amino acid oxidase-like deaminating enzyme
LTEKEYDYIIIGAGISGCTIAHELKKHTDSILLIDKNIDVAQGASGAAGAFLSPLLGKANKFKDLVTDALKYSTQFYLDNTSEYIDKCGTVRIPKDQKDQEKFDSYIEHMDFEYTAKDGGYFFENASVVDGYNICKTLIKDIQTQFNFDVHTIKYKNNVWHINNQIIAKKLILTTGANTKLIDEKYFNIRAVWGQRIVVETTSCINVNYHKECSVSRSIKNNKNTYTLSIGATHHRLVEGNEIHKDDTNIPKMTKELCTQCSNVCISADDTKNLIKKAKDITELEDIKVINELAGARACSVDYFPIVGELIDSKKTIEEFPYLVNGTNVQDERFSKFDNLYVINGVGGRGYVLAPYLAKQLSQYIIKDEKLYDIITPNRLFKRWVKKARKS